jgi:hypothetical protein
MGLDIEIILCFVFWHLRNVSTTGCFLRSQIFFISFVYEIKWTSSTKPYLSVRIFSQLKYWFSVKFGCTSEVVRRICLCKVKSIFMDLKKKCSHYKWLIRDRTRSNETLFVHITHLLLQMVIVNSSFIRLCTSRIFTWNCCFKISAQIVWDERNL